MHIYPACGTLSAGALCAILCRKIFRSTATCAYRQVENLACNMLLDTLPDELRGAYEPLLTGETQERLHDIVKAADKLSAYIKCIEERKAGNNEFLSAEKQNREQLEANPLPEVKYFMEHFIPAFELTLDELGTI